MQKEEKDLRDRTKAFALRIVRMFSTLPKTTEAQVLGKQLLRSGTSIGANYREAFRARSKAEFIAKCGDSLREIEDIHLKKFRTTHFYGSSLLSIIWSICSI